MAELPFIDSLGHYLLPHSTRKWTSLINGNILPTGGRDGGPALVDSSQLNKTFLNEYPSFTFGAAFIFVGAFFGDLFAAANATYSFGEGTCHLAQVGDGRLRVITPFGTTTPIVSGFVANLGVWYFIEVNFTLINNSGILNVGWEVHVNNAVIDSGTIVTTLTANNTGGDVPASPPFASISWVATGGSTRTCDFYCTTGEFLGDTVCRSYFPRVDGTYTAGIPSTSGSHFAMVKEHDPDDDATTIELAAISDRDSYLMDVISGFTTVKVAQFLWCAKKTAAGAASFKGTLTNGSDSLSPEFFPGFNAYAYFINGYRLSPFSGIDWTIAELNATEVGEQRIS